MAAEHKNPKGVGSSYEDRRAQAALMWADRVDMMSIAEIAKKYKVSTRTVSNRFKEFPREGLDPGLIVPVKPTFTPSPAMLTQTAQMWEDRCAGMTLTEIGKKHGLTESTVRYRLREYFPERPTVMLEKIRGRENDKLDHYEEEALKLLNTPHVVVSHGKVIIDPRTGEPMLDNEPRFKAIKTLLEIHSRRGKLNGSDAPQKAEVTHTVGERDEEDLMDLYEKARAKQEETEARIRKALEGGDIVDAEVVEDDE